MSEEMQATQTDIPENEILARDIIQVMMSIESFIDMCCQSGQYYEFVKMGLSKEELKQEIKLGLKTLKEIAMKKLVMDRILAENKKVQKKYSDRLAETDKEIERIYRQSKKVKIKEQ